MMSHDDYLICTKKLISAKSFVIIICLWLLGSIIQYDKINSISVGFTVMMSHIYVRT